MSGDQEHWDEIEADALKIGMMIRIDHRWLDHPFIRRFNRIASDKDIATIREAGLTRLFVRRESPEADPAPPPPPPPAPPAAPPASDDAAAAGSAPAPAAAPEETPPRADSTRLQREAITQSKKRYRVALGRAVEMFDMINAADPTAAKTLGGDIEHILAMLNNSASAPSLMCPVAAPRSQKRLALTGYDAVILAGVVGKRLGLKSAELRELTQAAAVHMVGLSRLPPQLMEEGTDGEQVRSMQFRDYPVLSAAILEKCGGFSADVQRIVREHRERPDGSGFPKGLKGDQIHPQALLLGAVRELLVRCCAEGVTPAIALAHMHRSAREIYGAAIVNHLAATLISHPVGTYVQLSDGRVGRVLSVDKENYLRPKVMVFEDDISAREVGEIDLAKETGLSILRVLETAQVPGQLESSRRGTWSREGVPAPAPPPEAAPEPVAAPPAQASGA